MAVCLCHRTSYGLCTRGVRPFSSDASAARMTVSSAALLICMLSTTSYYVIVYDSVRLDLWCMLWIVCERLELGCMSCLGEGCVVRDRHFAMDSFCYDHMRVQNVLSVGACFSHANRAVLWYGLKDKVS
eukprot:6159751-Pleurochrysis_carterae.AAC.2